MDLKRMGRPDSGEKLNAEPVALPIGASQPTPLHVLVARMVREHVAAERDVQPGSLEEEDDFEEDDPDVLDFSSQYTLSELQEEAIPSALLEEEPQAEKIDEALSEALKLDTGDSPDPNDSEPD